MAKIPGLKKSEVVRRDFLSFVSRHNLAGDSSIYAQYVGVKMLYEASRDAGLWNIQWKITNRAPTSQNIWAQWQGAPQVLSFSKSTAIAECDEISVLFAFLARKIGLHSTGLFWPVWNHTVAVWFPKSTTGKELRVIVPTTQIFLQPTDLFDTTKFDPWRRQSFWEYNGQDIPDDFLLPESLTIFFLNQIDKYAGASERTLQHLRYLREAVFTQQSTPLQAAEGARMFKREVSPNAKEDLKACDHFVTDMCSAQTKNTIYPGRGFSDLSEIPPASIEATVEERGK